MSRSKFEKTYFEGDESHFSKVWSYDLQARLNFWRALKYRKFIRYYSTHHKTLLDIGCAYGHFLNKLKKYYKVYGMDVSNFAIKIACDRVQCHCKQGDLEVRIPFNQKFDIITAISVLEHLNNPKRAVNNIHNALNDEGLFCFEIPTISNNRSKFIYDLFFSKDETHVFIRSVDEINDLVQSCGFKKLAIFCSFFPIFTKQKNWVENFSFIFGVYQKI